QYLESHGIRRSRHYPRDSAIRRDQWNLELRESGTSGSIGVETHFLRPSGSRLVNPGAAGMTRGGWWLIVEVFHGQNRCAQQASPRLALGLHWPKHFRGQGVFARSAMPAGQFQTGFGAVRMTVVQPHWMPTRIEPHVAREFARGVLQGLGDHPYVVQEQHSACV